MPYEDGSIVTTVRNKFLNARKGTAVKVCHWLPESTSTSTDGGFHGGGVKEQLLRRGCHSDSLSRPEIMKRLQFGRFCPSIRKSVGTEATAERSPGQLTGPSRRSRRRRGLVTRPPSPGQGAWSVRLRPRLCRSPAPACGSRSPPAAAPSAAPAQTSGGLRPRRVHCQWKTWRKGRSRPEDVVTCSCRWQESDTSASGHCK